MNISGREKETFDALRECAKKARRPVVLVNACTHGHEIVGLDVIKRLKNFSLERGELLFSIANEHARKANTSYIESDLNRVFPGNPKGTYEEQLATALAPVVEACDVVIDIHSTKTIKNFDERMLIVTKWNDATRQLVTSISAPKVLIMELNATNAFISQARVGIAFEYGPNDAQTADAITHSIKNILRSLGMISDEEDKEGGEHMRPSSVYRVYDTFPKKMGDVLHVEIQNFQPIQVGDIVAHSKSGEPIRAHRTFIPILFGENRYTDIFGFMGEKK